MTFRGGVAAAIGALALAGGAALAFHPSQKAIPLSSPVVIPFTEVSRHIVLDATVNGQALAFMFDTGDKLAIVDLDRAMALGLPLGASMDVTGIGSAVVHASWVRESTFGLRAFPGFSQPISLAMPLRRIAEQFGQNVDGIIGADFTGAFVVEIDYAARTMTLHDRATFHYAGPGEIVPVHVNGAGHPILEAEVTPVGGVPLKGKFTFDMGAGAAVTLHSPFAADHHLPAPELKTVRAIGSGGTGGASAGTTGRVAALRIGGFELRNPTATFSRDTAGAFANAEVAGNIGARIISRFRVFLDYGRGRIILERAPTFGDPFDAASSGLALRGLGTDYRTFQIDDVLEGSPASESGLRPGDVITSMDGQPASALTLAAIYAAFEHPVARKLTVRRGGQTLAITLLPRVLV